MSYQHRNKSKRPRATKRKSNAGVKRKESLGKKLNAGVATRREIRRMLGSRTARRRLTKLPGAVRPRAKVSSYIVEMRVKE